MSPVSTATSATRSCSRQSKKRDARRGIAFPVVHCQRRAHLRDERREEHLLADEPPRRAGARRLAQRLVEPRFLLGAQHRSPRAGRGRVSLASTWRSRYERPSSIITSASPPNAKRRYIARRFAHRQPLVERPPRRSLPGRPRALLASCRCAPSRHASLALSWSSQMAMHGCVACSAVRSGIEVVAGVPQPVVVERDALVRRRRLAPRHALDAGRVGPVLVDVVAEEEHGVQVLPRGDVAVGVEIALLEVRARHDRQPQARRRRARAACACARRATARPPASNA